MPRQSSELLATELVVMSVYLVKNKATAPAVALLLMYDSINRGRGHFEHIVDYLGKAPAKTSPESLFGSSVFVFMVYILRINIGIRILITGHKKREKRQLFSSYFVPLSTNVK